MISVPRLTLLGSDFDEAAYLTSNPDVAAAVARGDFKSGRQHAELFGRQESRLFEKTSAIERLRRTKFKKLEPLLLLDMPHRRLENKIDFLTDEQLGIASRAPEIRTHKWVSKALHSVPVRFRNAPSELLD